MDLNISVEEIEKNIIVRMEGRLDTLSVLGLEKRMDSLLEGNRIYLLMDFSRIDYLSSAGMRLLLAVTKRAKAKEGYLVIFSIQDDVLELLRIAGLDKVLEIRKNEKDALQFRK